MKKNIQSIKVNGKIVGEVEGGWFKKRIQGSKHFLKKPPAIAFDKESLFEAQRYGATMVQVTDTETGTVYKSSIDKIFEIGLELNRGFGEQIAMTFRFWDTESTNAPPHRGDELKDKSEPDAHQLKLF